MSAESLEMAKHDRIRQLILRIAFKAFPNAIDSELLRATLSTLGYPMTANDLRIYLAYLADHQKALLELEEKEEFSILLVTLTAKGMDVMDGRIRECGISC